jgi:hypothetical protein
MEFELPKKGEIVSLKEIETICIHFDLILLWDKIKNDPPQKLFKSDGCSCWLDSWKNKNGKKVSLYTVCFIHDLYYWAGYSKENIARFMADVKLMINVVTKTNKTWLGMLMFLGVRVGGRRWFFKTPFCWGFGRD